MQRDVQTRYTSHGYRTVRVLDHPRANANGYVYEHVLIAEHALGKPLPSKAQVHHWGARSDNTKLVICEDQAYHLFLHARQKAWRATGDVNKRPCARCKRFDDTENMSAIRPINGDSWRVWRGYHKECATAYQRERARRRMANG